MQTIRQSFIDNLGGGVAVDEPAALRHLLLLANAIDDRLAPAALNTERGTNELGAMVEATSKPTLPDELVERLLGALRISAAEAEGSLPADTHYDALRPVVERASVIAVLAELAKMPVELPTREFFEREFAYGAEAAPATSNMREIVRSASWRAAYALQVTLGPILAAKDEEIARLAEWNRKHAATIDTLQAKVAELESALAIERDACARMSSAIAAKDDWIAEIEKQRASVATDLVLAKSRIAEIKATATQKEAEHSITIESLQSKVDELERQLGYDPESLALTRQHQLMLANGVSLDDPGRIDLETRIRARLGTFMDTPVDRIAHEVAAEIMRERRPTTAAERKEFRDRLRAHTKERIQHAKVDEPSSSPSTGANGEVQNSEREQYETTIRQKNERIAELEKTLAERDIQYETLLRCKDAMGIPRDAFCDLPARIALLKAKAEKRVAELEKRYPRVECDFCKKALSLQEIKGGSCDCGNAGTSDLENSIRKQLGWHVDVPTELATKRNTELEKRLADESKAWSDLNESCCGKDEQIGELRVQIADLEKQLAPMVVDDKTPGEVFGSVFFVGGADTWPKTGLETRAKIESASQAVLRTFGRKMVLEALERIRERVRGYQTGSMGGAVVKASITTIVDDELAQFDAPKQLADTPQRTETNEFLTEQPRPSPRVGPGVRIVSSAGDAIATELLPVDRTRRGTPET